MRVWLLQRAEPTPHDDEGSQRLLRTGTVASMLAQRGHEVLWWTSTFDHYNRRHRYENDTRVEVAGAFSIQYLRGCGYRRNVSLSRLRDNHEVANRFAILAAGEPSRPDVILASLPTAELGLQAVRYGRQRDIPVVLDIRDLWPDVFFDVVPRHLHSIIKMMAVPMRRALREACKDASAIIGLTEAFVEWGVEHAGRERSDLDRSFPMAYLPSPIQEEDLVGGRAFWNAANIRRRVDQLVVAFCGNLGRTNDLVPVLDAAAILQERRQPVLFVICGDGEMADELRSRSRHLDNVRFVGWIHKAQIRALLEIADIGLAPYIDARNYVSNIPNKPAEYLSAGLPVASSLGRGELFHMIENHECGFSYRGRADVLASSLERLLHEHTTLERWSSNAHHTYRTVLDGNVVYKQMIDYLQVVADSSGISCTRR